MDQDKTVIHWDDSNGNGVLTVSILIQVLSDRSTQSSGPVLFIPGQSTRQSPCQIYPTFPSKKARENPRVDKTRGVAAWSRFY